MHLSIHSKSPGFEVDMFVIPNKVENQSLIDRFLNGNKNPDKEIPVIDWTMDNDTLYYREYDQFETKKMSVSLFDQSPIQKKVFYTRRNTKKQLVKTQAGRLYQNNYM